MNDLSVQGLATVGQFKPFINAACKTTEYVPKPIKLNPLKGIYFVLELDWCLMNRLPG